jgi:hypothetical protein
MLYYRCSRIKTTPAVLIDQSLWASVWSGPRWGRRGLRAPFQAPPPPIFAFFQSDRSRVRLSVGCFPAVPAKVPAAILPILQKRLKENLPIC